MVSSWTLWQASAQKKRVEVIPNTGIMNPAISRTATSVQMMYRGRVTGFLNPAREILGISTLLAQNATFRVQGELGRPISPTLVWRTI